jgi:hypothetical protein
VERCHGKTKAGARCKRNASSESRFCSIHADQAKAAAGAAGPSGGEGPASGAKRRDPLETIIAATALGVVVVAALTLRRLFRFF